tara:strand:+ start:92 stop:1087 length:996 start_codon:yes stop_codon:yes gene_type:complete
MGIHNLTSLIKSKSPDSINTEALYKLSGSTVAIDTSIFLYKSLTNIRSNGDYIRNKNGDIISHIIGILNKTILYLSFNIKPIYIFDGKPPIEKKELLQQRSKKAKEQKLLSEKSTTIEDKNKYEKNSVRMNGTHITDIKKLLDVMGIKYIHPDGEAEAYASELCRIGYVDYVVTDDMDSLVFGCPKMIRKCLDKNNKRNDVVSIISLENVLKGFNMSMNEFTEMCILCGCDYCPTIPKVGSIRSFNYIQNYKSIEKLIESKKCKIPDEFIQRYLKAKELFCIFKDKIDISTIDLNNSEYNETIFKNYLLNNCSFNDNKVDSILKKIKKFDN